MRPGGRDALEGKGPQRRAQRRLDGRLEEVAKAVGGGYCRLQMPLAIGTWREGDVPGRRLGALQGGGGGYLPPFQCIPACGVPLLPPEHKQGKSHLRTGKDSPKPKAQWC